MALVDYSSDSGSEEESNDKRLVKTNERQASSAKPVSLPPLPASFHDLYASTVRSSTHDDRTMHQGRTRQIPHVAGNWPSHIYVEWYPTPEESELLNSLVSALRSEVGGDNTEIHTFLTSDLATPLPLHISLSRSFVLTTEEKDDFLRRLTAVVRQESGVTRFCVVPSALSWHRSPDSNRAFLVLRVKEQDASKSYNRGGGLTRLLTGCNSLVRQFGQPELYVKSSKEQPQSATANTDFRAAVEDKFHVSVAWSFVEVTEDLLSRTRAVYNKSPPVSEGGFRHHVERMRIPVESVKVKIGNVVTNLALPERGRRCAPEDGGGLFGR